jgi:hypothetical protein
MESNAGTFSSSQHVQAAIKNMEEHLSKRDDVNWNLPTKEETPLQKAHCLELNVSPELQPTDAACCKSLFVMLRWIVELERVDVCLECSMLSSYLALPKEGHLCQLFQVFACLKSTTMLRCCVILVTRLLTSPFFN